MPALLALLLPAALAESPPARTWALDSPVVRAAAQGAWVRLPRTPFRSWFACESDAVFRRGAEATDPLATVCAEARDLGRVVQVLTVRVERVALGETRVVVDGPLPERDRLARRYLRAVDGLLQRAEDPRDPLYELWIASSDPTARIDRARAALAATAETTGEGCARRVGWLRAADPDGWRPAARARVALAADACAATLAGELLSAGDDAAPLRAAVVARIEATAPPAAEGLRTSLPAWPEPLRAALAADLARWDAAAAATTAAARAAHEAALAALPEPLRACRAATAAALTSGPTPAAAALDPAGTAGRTAAWPLPLALWIPPTSARSGYVEDGRGGVAWSATLPAGVPLADTPGRPTTLVTGTLRAEELRGADGRLRMVPALDVRCIPSVELPPALRPAWSPIDGWAFPPAP